VAQVANELKVSAAAPVAHVSSDPKSDQLKGSIEEEKKKRNGLIDQMRRLRNKLNYKQAEYAAISKLSDLNRAPKNLGRLKRMKSDLEFKIATEATTLSAERELIKKLNEINNELEDALKVYRARRKVELVSKDIEDIGKALEQYKTQVLDVDKKLDALYSELRSITGWKRQATSEEHRPRRAMKEEHFEVSLEDIATIKKTKKEDKGSG
jgi:uncharacterized coiled-coil DUF342 family protein